MTYNKSLDYGVKYADIQNIVNFRDLGGIKLPDGSVVKDHLIFRSGPTFDLSPQEKVALQQLQIKHIFDLRSADEVAIAPDYVPEGTTYHNIPSIDSKRKMAIKGNLNDFAPEILFVLPSNFLVWAFKTHFKGMYRKFPFKNKAYSKMFEAMDKGESFLFHCTAGKDRTGVASMVILMALGADYQLASQDYLLSNLYRQKTNQEFLDNYRDDKHFDKLEKTLQASLVASMEYLDSAYNAIVKKYGNIYNYLQKEYGVDEARLQLWKQNYTTKQ